MTRLHLRFDEVEHDGDLEPILADLTASGATVLSSEINDDDTATVTIEVADKTDFRIAFRKTESAEWLT